MNNQELLQDLCEDLTKNHDRICAHNANIGFFYEKGENIIMDDLLHQQTKLLAKFSLIVGRKALAPFPQSSDYMTFSNGVAKNGAQA
jgi:hypothetical protein